MAKFPYRGFGMFLLALVILSIGCKSTIGGHLCIDEKYPPNAIREDFIQALKIIRKNHPALYDFTNKEKYDKLVNEQSKKITDSLRLADFYTIISPLVTKIGCGHSQVWMPEWTWKDSTVTILPLKLFFDKGKAYVLCNYSPDKRLKAGDEIISINGKTIAALQQTTELYISTDGNNASAKRAVLNSIRFNRLLAIEENYPKNYTLALRSSADDSLLTVDCTALRQQTYPDTPPTTDSLLQFKIDSSKKVAIITIKSFGFYDSVAMFKKFTDNCFSRIKQVGITNIILDLRDNGGGDPFCSSYLLGYLAKEPVAYFAAAYEPYANFDKPMPLAANHFTGKLYVLINGICFSSTAHLCALLKYHHIGEFIGSETGGTYKCNDNSQTFRLINTGILIRMAHNTFAVAVRDLPRFKGIVPDFAVEPGIEDMLAGKDTVKTFALERIKSN